MLESESLGLVVCTLSGPFCSSWPASVKIRFHSVHSLTHNSGVHSSISTHFIVEPVKTVSFSPCCNMLCDIYYTIDLQIPHSKGDSWDCWAYLWRL